MRGEFNRKLSLSLTFKKVNKVEKTFNAKNKSQNLYL